MDVTKDVGVNVSTIFEIVKRYEEIDDCENHCNNCAGHSKHIEDRDVVIFDTYETSSLNLLELKHRTCKSKWVHLETQCHEEQ